MSIKSICFVGCVLVSAAIACNAPSPAAGGTTPSAPAAATTAAPDAVFTPSITPTTAPVVPTVPAEGGFTGGTPLDVSGLPILQILPMGMGPFFCNGTAATTPTVTLENAANRIMHLCFYNFPVTEGSYSFTVTLTEPDGVTQHTETYTVGATDTGVTIVNSLNELVGQGYTEADLGTGAQPNLGMFVNTEANIPVGTWMVSVSAPSAPGGAIEVAATPVNVVHTSPLVSAVGSLNTNLLVDADMAHTAGDTIYVFGTDYAPNTPLMVVFYYEDPALPPTEFETAQLRALVGTNVTTDAQGKFRVDFVVGPSTPTANYYVIAEPAIPADYPFNPFTGGFIIE